MILFHNTPFNIPLSPPYKKGDYSQEGNIGILFFDFYLKTIHQRQTLKNTLKF